MWTELGTLAAALGVGFCSAFIPIINAELAVTAAVLSSPPMLGVLAAVAVAFGQTAGKMVLFEAGRRGSSWRRKRHEPRKPLTGWQLHAVDLLRSRWRGGGIVLLSASVGLPPLALVSIVAGSVKARRVDFLVCCLVGRTARFVAVAGTLIAAR